MFPEGDVAGWFALSFSLGNAMSVRLKLISWVEMGAEPFANAEWLLFTEQDFKPNHHAELHAVPCKWRYFNCLFQQVNPRCTWEESGGCWGLDAEMLWTVLISSFPLPEPFVWSNVILSWAKQNHRIRLKTHQTVSFKTIGQSVNFKDKPFSSLLSCTDSVLALSISSMAVHELTLTLGHWDNNRNEKCGFCHLFQNQ